MIIIIEPVCSQHVHVPFCAAFIESVAEAFPDQEIMYCATSSQSWNVKAYRSIFNADNSNIKWEIIDEFDYGASAYYESKRTLSLVNKYQALNPFHIYISTTNLLGLFFLNFKNRRYGIRVFPILHRSVLQLQSQKIAIKLIASLIARFNYIDKRIYPVVLSKEIIQNIKLIYPKFSRQFRSISHPYFFFRNQGDSIKKITKVGFLGRGSKDRGYDKFLQISKKVPDVSFYGIGSLAKDIDNDEQSALKMRMSEKQVDTEIYNNTVMEVDAIIMPLDSNSYNYTMSGAIMDALSFKKPLLLIDSEFSRNLLLKFGTIGKIFKDETDLIDFLNKPSYSEDQRIEFHKITLAQEKSALNFSCSTVSKQIKSNFNEAFINNQ